MGQALYRKYRSKSLDELVGQEHVTKTLANALKEGRISHAYLLTGPRGTGKTSIARIVAHAINELPYDGENSHLDIIEIDAASNNGVEDVRDLREKVRLAPTSAKYKVYIIDEVHMLSNAAFNALLKTLEEPPEHAVFILATTEVHKLPATIISRTQRFQLQLIPREKIIAHLKEIAKKEDIKIDDDALELIAEHGDGAFRDSISLLDQLRGETKDGITAATVEAILGLAPRHAIKALLEALQSGKVSEVVTSYQTLLSKGISPAALAQQLIGIMRGHAPGQPSLYQLIDDLIEVPRAYNPRLKMEVVLATFALRHASDDSTHVQTPNPPAQKSEPGAPPAKRNPPPDPAKTVAKSSSSAATPPPQLGTEGSNPSTPAKKKEEPVAPTSSEPLPALTDELWQAICDAAKLSGPTIYTVIRQAIPHFDEEKQLLTLTFRFPLHQKRIEENRIRQDFWAILTKVWGGVPQMQVILNKNAVRHIPAAKPVSVDTEGGQDPIAGNVMNLMGGGEVVNV